MTTNANTTTDSARAAFDRAVRENAGVHYTAIVASESWTHGNLYVTHFCPPGLDKWIEVTHDGITLTLTGEQARVLAAILNTAADHAVGCPNPWHNTAPCRAKMRCPECPDDTPAH